jgi:hypothetical protein
MRFEMLKLWGPAQQRRPPKAWRRTDGPRAGVNDTFRRHGHRGGIPAHRLALNKYTPRSLNKA